MAFKLLHHGYPLVSMHLFLLDSEEQIVYSEEYLASNQGGKNLSSGACVCGLQGGPMGPIQCSLLPQEGGKEG